MKKFSIVLILPFLISCGGNSETIEQIQDTVNNTVIAANDYLECSYDENGQPSFIDENKEVVIPFGKYEVSFSDLITGIGFVADSTGKILCIDINGKELFEVYNFENGPDYIEEGTFRIVKDDKIGYANEAGEIIIEPQYTCAFPFQDGKAKVALKCTETLEFEMTKWESDEWFFINQAGEIVTE